MEKEKLDHTQMQIMESALELFVEKGFQGQQMHHVAEAARVSPQTLSQYFKDKYTLAMAILGSLFHEMEEYGEQSFTKDIRSIDMPVIEKLRFFMFTTWIGDHHLKIRKYMAEFDLFFRGKEEKDYFRKRIIEFYPKEKIDFVEKILIEGQKNGTIRKELDPHLTLVTLVNSVRSLDQRLLLQEGCLINLLPEEKNRMRYELIDLLLRGIST